MKISSYIVLISLDFFVLKLLERHGGCWPGVQRKMRCTSGELKERDSLRSSYWACTSSVENCILISTHTSYSSSVKTVHSA